jgi:hypothetical protein
MLLTEYVFSKNNPWTYYPEATNLNVPSVSSDQNHHDNQKTDFLQTPNRASYSLNSIASFFLLDFSSSVRFDAPEP